MPEEGTLQEVTQGTPQGEGVSTTRALPTGVQEHLSVDLPEVPQQWLTRLEYLQKDLQDVQHQIAGISREELQGVPFTDVVMADELPKNCRTPAITQYDGSADPQEHLCGLRTRPCCTDRRMGLNVESS
ncbi:UNVERIFIED_CONTAM: hypothetical protein Sindi_2265700 [Sesamum indicum]